VAVIEGTAEDVDVDDDELDVLFCNRATSSVIGRYVSAGRSTETHPSNRQSNSIIVVVVVAFVLWLMRFDFLSVVDRFLPTLSTSTFFSNILAVRL